MEPSNTTGGYQYDDLPAGDVIRYLTLHPGTPDDPLQCTLHTTCMADADFEAMSYVWGSDERNQQILCNDHVFQITTNLHRVLKRVRRPDVPRNLWADLICINQEDLDEKGHQVSIMGQIYRRAQRVLIVMGADDGGHGAHVSSLVEDVYTRTEQILPEIAEGWNAFPFPSDDDPILTDPRWESLRVLLDDNWFTRGWVVREAGFAQDGQVLWGHSEFSWHKLMRTINWLYKRAVKTLYAKGLDQSIPLAHVELFEDHHPTYAKLFTSEMTWVDQSLLGYLSLTRQLNLKDPRDRIYAFLELVHGENRLHLRPNYKDHFLHVYQEFAVEYIQTTGFISLLSNVEHNEESLAAGIPSWVPRWDLPLTRTGYAFAPADSGYPSLQPRSNDVNTPPAPTVKDFNTLQVRGVLIDSILYASDRLSSTTTTTTTIANIWRAIEALQHSTSPYPIEHRLSVFIGILTAGTLEGDVRDWLLSEATYYQTIYSQAHFPETLHDPSPWAGTASQDMFHNMVKGYTHHRKIILTERGYMGLAPAMARVGDLCGILFGCTTPSVLRAKGEEGGFEYLGATYVVGKKHWTTLDGREVFNRILGSEDSKDWVEWGVEERVVELV